jgi:predicted nucleotidyltransferase
MTDGNGLRHVLRRHRGEILALAEKYGIETVRVFGSVARGQADRASDVDLLVSFQAGRSLLDQIAFQQDVSELLGMTVDVVSTEGLSPYIRDDVVREAVPV